MNRAIILASLLVLGCSSVFFPCSCSKIQTVTEEKEITSPTNEEKASAGEAKLEKLKELEIVKKKKDYLKEQRIPSKLDIEDGLYFYKRGISLSEAKNYEHAVIAFTRALNSIPQFWSAYLERGWNSFLLGNYEKSISDYEMAISLNREYADSHYKLGLAYGILKNHEEAIRAYNEAINIEPGEGAYYGVLVPCLRNLFLDIGNLRYLEVSTE